jgi:hypothetical protein
MRSSVRHNWGRFRAGLTLPERVEAIVFEEGKQAIAIGLKIFVKAAQFPDLPEVEQRGSARIDKRLIFVK